MPNYEEYSDPRAIAEMAYEAEQAGWDGFFVWDHMLFVKQWMPAIADPWILLTAAAMRTERIKLGPMVTPVPRRRPWKLARETVTLDHLSGGRLILGVGLGWPPDADFATFGEDPDNRVRAGKLDEGLDILAGLWTGELFSYQGTHYQVTEARFLPTPLQQPRIPIWVAGFWPHKAPFRRAARWDGIFPLTVSGEPGREDIQPTSPDGLATMVAYVREHRTGAAPFDVVLGGETPGDDPAAGAAIVAPYAAAGLTWWVEGLSDWRGSFAAMRARLRQGPPRER